MDFPFGPSALGSLPAALSGTTWLLCDSSADLAGDLASQCSEVLAPVADDAGVTDWELYMWRFSGDGTIDSLEFYAGGSGYAYWDCGTRAGADDVSLRLFACDDDDWSAARMSWEIRELAGVRYLILGDGEFPDLYVAAPADFELPTDDACASAPAQTCVVR